MTTYTIFSASKPMPANQQVKRIGQYLYRHIDGAYDYRSGPNYFDVYFILLYELKPELRKPDQEYPVQEMGINLNITTYQNKIRINITEITPQERTIGSDVYSPEKVQDLTKAYSLIMGKIYRRICRAYDDYHFMY